jgi:hypothetical protein
MKFFKQTRIYKNSKKSSKFNSMRSLDSAKSGKSSSNKAKRGRNRKRSIDTEMKLQDLDEDFMFHDYVLGHEESTGGMSQFGNWAAKERNHMIEFVRGKA